MEMPGYGSMQRNTEADKAFKISCVNGTLFSRSTSSQVTQASKRYPDPEKKSSDQSLTTHKGENKENTVISEKATYKVRTQTCQDVKHVLYVMATNPQPNIRTEISWCQTVGQTFWTSYLFWCLCDSEQVKPTLFQALF